MAKISVFSEVSNHQFEKLKQQEEHEKAKLDELFNVGDYFKYHSHRLIEKQSKLQNMGHGHLGTIKATNHSVEVMEDGKLSFQQPYRAGPTEREHEKK